MQATRQRKGFTLIELMVVIFICGVLVGLGVMSMRHLAQEGAVESTARKVERRVMQTRTWAMRLDIPCQLTYNSTVPEAKNYWVNNLSTDGGYDEKILRFWREEVLHEVAKEGKTAPGPSFYSDAPEDQWLASIGPAPMYDKDPVLGGKIVKFRPAYASHSPEELYNNKSKRLDLINRTTGEWDPWDIQQGPRLYLNEGVRFWRREDIPYEMRNAHGHSGTGRAMSECLLTRTDGVAPGTMMGRGANSNLICYPRGTFNKGEAAAYHARGGRFAHIYMGVVYRDDSETRRILTFNPITGVIIVSRDWDLIR